MIYTVKPLYLYCLLDTYYYIWYHKALYLSRLRFRALSWQVNVYDSILFHISCCLNDNAFIIYV